MSFVLAVSTGVAGGFGAFVLVMSLIGFLLIRADKMRWLKHKERTDVLMRIPPKEGEKISKKRREDFREEKKTPLHSTTNHENSQQRQCPE